MGVQVKQQEIYMSMQQLRDQQRKKQLAAEKEMDKSYSQAEKKAKQVCARARGTLPSI